MSTIIFTMTHKAFDPPKDPMFVPLQVGRALREDLGYMGDDTGDSISEWNPYFSELTGMYWVWKNFLTDGNVGLCHYRRFLIHEDGRVITEKEYDKLLCDYDLVTTKQVVLNNSYYDGYAANHHVKDLIETGNVIKEIYPEYAGDFERIVHGNRTYFGNMIVCKKELFDAYAKWLFDILFRVKERIDIENYDNYRKRVFGFVSEILLLVYVQHHGLKVLECKVGMPQEKVETKEVKQKLAEYFAQKDYVGAGQYMRRALQNRPDILMEASDIDGQLMLTLEIIAICEQEDKAGEKIILETYSEFSQLMKWVRELNELVKVDLLSEGDPKAYQEVKLEASPEVSPDKWRDLREQKQVSKQAYEVACTFLLCKDGSM